MMPLNRKTGIDRSHQCKQISTVTKYFVSFISAGRKCSASPTKRWSEHLLRLMTPPFERGPCCDSFCSDGIKNAINSANHAD